MAQSEDELKKIQSDEAKALVQAVQALQGLASKDIRDRLKAFAAQQSGELVLNFKHESRFLSNFA